jgi:hypothetical protein
VSEHNNRWRSRRHESAASQDSAQDSKSTPEQSVDDSGRPPQACPEPTLDPLPAVADDSLSGVAYAIERAGLVYYRGCRALASTINRLKQMGD